VIEAVNCDPPVDAAASDHLFQARLPVEIYNWLRTQWYEQRVPMNSVVVAAVTALRERRLDVVRIPPTGGEESEATQRFTVRLPVADYEWLRAEAFRRRLPINRLLSAGLAIYQASREGTTQAAGADEPTR